MIQIFDIEKVKSLIIQPMIDRGWNPPKNANLEVISQDYIDSLKKYDEDTLKMAFNRILGKHKYRSWPSVADFLEICRANTPAFTNYDTDNTAQAALRTKKATAYAMGQIDKVFAEAWKGGWFIDARKWLTQKACEQIRNGQEPNIPLESWYPWDNKNNEI